MSDWKTLSSKIVLETAWIKIRRDEVLNHKGKHLTYTYIENHHPSVFIVVVNDKQEILIQREYKHTIKRYYWTIPAGFSENDDLLAAAKRELLEEAGLVSDDWTDLGPVQPCIGIANLPQNIFLARNVRFATDQRDEDEQIEDQRFVPLKEIEQMIVNGEFYDAPALAGVYAAKIRGI